jgi:ABC-type transport system substrate-binding protein
MTLTLRAAAAVSTNGDYEFTLRLKWTQPACIALLASGYSVVYPCHVPPADMRQHPIGTGPFKFADHFTLYGGTPPALRLGHRQVDNRRAP